MPNKSHWRNKSLDFFKDPQAPIILRLQAYLEIKKFSGSWLNITAKDLAGAATDFELVLNTYVKINRIDINEKEDIVLNLTDRFNMKRNNDRYEEDSYEKLLKRNFATSVYQKIIFNLSK